MPVLDTLAIILGGGRGTRLFPLTKLRAKPAVPIAGKYRLIDIPVSNCINSGINRICVLTQFLSMSLQRHVYSTYSFDAFSKGFIELMPAEQTLTGMDWYQGSADAVRRRLGEFMSRAPEDVLILAGDHLYRMDYSEFVQFHRSSKADVTVGVIPVSAQDAPRYGILKTNTRNRIIRWTEKPGPEALPDLESYPGQPRPFLGSMGIYIFNMKALAKILGEHPGDDFGKNIVPAAVEHMDVYAFPFHGYWEDIGTIGAFYGANLALTRENAPFDFYDFLRPIYTRSRFLPPTRVENSTLRRVVVSDGCRLFKAQIENCIIGLRGCVQEGVQMANVVMMGSDYYDHESVLGKPTGADRLPLGIGRGSRIERAILDKNVRIGENVVIRSHEGSPDQDTDLYSIRDGVVVIPKDTIIPSGTQI